MFISAFAMHSNLHLLSVLGNSWVPVCPVLGVTFSTFFAMHSNPTFFVLVRIQA